jgi:DNA-binding NarL/FixJ family response regulator
MTQRVLIAEDIHLLREGLVHLLQAHGFTVVAAVQTGPELLEALLRLRPDVSVVDVRLPPTFTDEGLRAALAARAEVPGLPVLVLSQNVEQLYARELLADGSGGTGYLLKDRVLNAGQFVDAIRRVAGGGTVMDTEVIAKLLAGNSRHKPLGRLSDREYEVLKAMAEGCSNVAIAELLFLSESAISKHIASIFTKLDLTISDDNNRRVLAVLAYLNAANRS